MPTRQVCNAPSRSRRTAAVLPSPLEGDRAGASSTRYSGIGLSKRERAIVLGSAGLESVVRSTQKALKLTKPYKSVDSRIRRKRISIASVRLQNWRSRGSQKERRNGRQLEGIADEGDQTVNVQ